jgi:propionyl-CoA synthetase
MIYNIGPGDRFWAASDVGWVVGHSYICYGPLIAGAPPWSSRASPSAPPPGAFWRIIQNHRIKSFFTAPTALRAIRREDPTGEWIRRYKLHDLQALFLAGERADPDTVKWAQEHLGVPVVDHWWQTETGWAIAANPIGIEVMPTKLGSPSVPMPGYDVQVLDEGGNPVPRHAGRHRDQAAAAPRHAADAVECRSRFRKSYLTISPAITRPATRAISTRTAIFTSWPAPMT